LTSSRSQCLITWQFASFLSSSTPIPELKSVLGNQSIVSPACLFLLVTLLAVPGFAQFENEQPQGKGVQLGKEVTQRWQVGVRIEATTGDVRGLFITVPVPSDYPEQEVRVLVEDYSANVGAVKSRILEGGVKQLLVTVPQVRAGDEAHAIVTLEVVTREMLAPADTSIFVIPRRTPRDVSKFLGTSPFIDSRHSTVRKLAKELTENVEGDWQKVEAIYQWTRGNIKAGDGEMKGSLEAIRDQQAIAEDVVNVFVSLCRAAKIPARIVWVNGGFYAEFYLQDQEGEGYWFPAQLVGGGGVGSSPNPRPILQKGDNIKVPEMEEPQRYVPELVKGQKGGGSARVTFIRELQANE
jgi:hypothetical protein